MKDPNPLPGPARTVRLIAGLLGRRLVNRLRSGLRRRKTAAGAKRTGTGGKATFGWAGSAFIAVVMGFNGVNITSQLLRNIREAEAPILDAAGRFEVSDSALRQMTRIDEVSWERGLAGADTVQLRRIFTRELAQSISAHRETGVDEMLAQFRQRGMGGFTSTEGIFIPRLVGWDSPASAPALWKLLGAGFSLFCFAWLCMDMGSYNQDLGRVEWTLEWLFTFPVSAGRLFLAQILGCAFAEPLMWGVAWPMLSTLFVSAGWGWWSIPLGAAGGLYASILVASVRVAVETLLRTTMDPPRLKNLQALFTVAGMLSLFLLLGNIGKGSFSGKCFAMALNLPDAVSWLPFALPSRLPGAHGSLAAVLLTMAGCLFAFPLASMALCQWRVRNGLLSVSSAYAGSRGKPAAGKRARRDIGARGIVGKDLRLLLRDRNFLVQTLVTPILVIGFQLVVNSSILGAVRINFQHASVLAFSVGGYVLIATALSVLSVEGNSLWLLYTMPRSIPSILLEKTKLWSVTALIYTVTVLGICAALNPALAPGDAGFALLAIAGVILYAFIAAGIGILGTDPLEPEMRRRMRPDMVQLYMLLAAMYAYAIYAPSIWTRAGQLVLSACLAFALWQKVRDRAPFLLDPTAAPAPSVSLADGLIAALAFFVLQGLVMLFLLAVRIPPGPGLFMAFAIAGAIVVSFSLYVFWRNKVHGVMISVGLQRDPAAPGMRTPAAVALGAFAGISAAAFAAFYLRMIDYVPALKAMKMKGIELSFDPGIWLPLLAVFAAPVFEEFIFRGLIFRGLRRSTNALFAVLGSAAIFAIVHPPLSVVPVFVLGVVAAWSFERSKLLVSGITAHMVYNATVIAIQWSAR